MEEDNINEVFGAEFFDEGKNIPCGGYKTYHLNQFYLQFSRLATWIRDSFNPQRVLDVGCAKGFLVKAFKDLGIESWGVDVSQYVISNAPDDIGANLYIVDLNRDALPFKDSSFDFVTFLGTIEYLTNHKHALREINRVLRQGGGLYFTTIYKKDPRDRLRLNIHDRGYWIKEFRSNGFRIASGKLSTYLREERLPRTFATTQGNSVESKLGRLLYQKGGYIGKQIVFLVTRYIGLTYGILLFIKER